MQAGPVHAVAALLWGAAPAVGDTPREQVAPIGVARADADGDGVPDALGRQVVVRGTVTYARYPARGGREYRAYLEDPTGALRLVEGAEGTLAAARLWDFVEVTGVVGHYRGVTTLEVERLSVLAHGEPLEPRRISLKELNADPERFEGRLVRVEGRPRTLEDVLVDDGTGRVRIYLRRSVFGDVAANRVVGSRAVRVVGIVEQYDSEPPFDGNYRLTPRFTADLAPASSADNGLLTVLLAATLVLGLSVMSYQAVAGVRRRRRRSATGIESEHDVLRSRLARLRARQAVFMSSGPDPSALVVRPEARHVAHLTAALAHRVNNALTVILGNLEHVAEGTSAAAPQRAIRDAAEAGEDIRSTMEDLGYLLPAPALNPRLTDVDPLVARIAAEVTEPRAGAVPVFTVLDAPRAVSVDPARLERVLRHLVRNAFEAMPEGGSLRFRTAEVEVRAGEVAGLQPGSYVVIEVADTGVGMDPATLGRSTEPFFTTRLDRLAMGLGLFVAHRFAQLSGGILELKSAPGEGTRARLYLPTPTPRLHR